VETQFTIGDWGCLESLSEISHSPRLGGWMGPSVTNDLLKPKLGDFVKEGQKGVTHKNAADL